MYCTPVETKTARKNCRCTYCGETIFSGEMYMCWDSIEYTRFTSKLHLECSDELDGRLGSFEYIPHNNERPPNTDKFYNMVKYLENKEG